MRWKDLCISDGRMLVRMRESVLNSDQEIVAIFAHECLEVEALRKRLQDSKTISVGELCMLTAEGMKNNLHWMAWREANRIVVNNFGRPYA